MQPAQLEPCHLQYGVQTPCLRITSAPSEATNQNQTGPEGALLMLICLCGSQHFETYKKGGITLVVAEINEQKEGILEGLEYSQHSMIDIQCSIIDTMFNNRHVKSLLECILTQPERSSNPKMILFILNLTLDRTKKNSLS